MSRTGAGALVFLFAVPLLYAGTPHAQTAPLVKKEAGIVTSLSGRADIAHAATPQPVSLRTQDPVFGGDRIRSFEKSLVRVLLGGKALVTIRELSTFTLTEEPGHASVTLPRGKLALSVARLRMNPGESIEIRTPNAIAAVRGTVLIVQVEGPDTAFEEPIDLDKVSVTFTVLKGTVEVFRLNAALPPTTLRSFEEMKMAGKGKGEVREISAAEAAQLVEGFKSALPFTEGSGSDGGTRIAKREMAKALALAKFLAPDSVSEQTIEGEADQQLPTSTDGDAKLASASLPLADATNGTAAASTLVPILDSGPQQSQTQTPLPGSLTETTGSQVFLGSNFGGDGGPLVIPPDQTINTNQTFTTATHTSGTLSGTGIVTTTGLYTWSSGTMSGTGNTVANGGLALGGAGSTQTLDQRTLVVNNATLTNSGTFTASNGADILGTNSTLTNTGTFNVTGTGTSTIVAALNNSGTLDVQSGTLNLTGGGTDTGSVTVASGATLQFGGGTHNLNAGTALIGNGTVQMSAGSVNVNTDGVDRLTGALSVTGGTLTVNGDLASLTTGQSLNPTANAFNFTGGEVTITGGFSDLVDVAGGTMSLTGSLLTKSGAGALSVEKNLVTITAGGKLTGTGSVPLAQFTGGTVSVGTAGEGHGSLFIVDGDGSSMALAGTLLNSANTTVQLGFDLLQVHNGASFSSQSTNPLIEFTGGSLEADGFLFNSSAATVGGSLFKATNTVLTQPRGQPLAYVELVGATLNVGRSVLELTNSNLNLTGAPGDQPVIKLTGGSSFLSTAGPLIRMNGGTLNADAAVITDSTFNSFSTRGTVLDLVNAATVTMRTVGEEQAVNGFVDTFTISLALNEPFYRLNGSSLTFTQINQDGIDLSPNGEGLGIQSGVTLIATNGSTFTTGSALLSLENITYTDSNPQIQLSNSTLTTTGARNLIEAIHSTPMVTGPLLTATDSTLNLSGGLLSVEPGAQLTTPTTSALVTLTGGTHTVATNTGAALFDVKGAPFEFTTQTVDGLLLELGTSPAVHGGTVAAPAALSASLLQTSGATVITGTAVRVDTALLEATAPLIQALANSNVAVSGGAAFQVGTRATLRNSGSATSSVVFLDGSKFTANGGPLFNLTGVGGSYLHTVAGDLLFLTNGSVLDVTSLTNGFLISAAGSSVVDINGALVRFGTGTNGGNSVIVRNNVAPTTVIPVGEFNFPVVLTGGAQLSQITIQGTPVKNLPGNTITLTNNGSLFAIDGAGARITIRGN
jgi:hypothetical protein